MTKVNLWGDIPIKEEVKTPLAILREQAAILGELTNEILIARVHRKKDAREFEYTFYMIAPALENYTYAVLSVEHGIELYPIEIHDMAADRYLRCDDEQGFIVAICEILSSERMKRIIVGLISQSKFSE